MHLIPKESIVNIQVSSVLNKDVRNYGKKNLFDGSSVSCWNSDEGTPQWVSVEFSQLFKISAFSIEFQGGFVGRQCSFEISCNGETFTESFFPDDVNGIQKFLVSKPHLSKHVKFIFSESTDLFGRIIIYSISMFSD